MKDKLGHNYVKGRVKEFGVYLVDKSIRHTIFNTIANLLDVYFANYYFEHFIFIVSSSYENNCIK